MTSSNANWNFPTRVWFGEGRIADLPLACKEVEIGRPLFVIDPGLSKTSMVQSALRSLRDAGLSVEVFDQLQANPTSKNLEDGIAAYQKGKHDGIIAFGGGSALDIGKTVGFMVAQSRPVWEFEDVSDYWRRANTKGMAPVVAVPTTSGTGSEVGRATVITESSTGTKRIIFHPNMMPRIAIADPELTVSLPPLLTAGTGMDALAHSLEAYCVPGYHPMADAVALESIRLIRDWLPRAVQRGDDIEARGQMMAAAAMGATAFQKGLGAIHSLSHPIGAIYKTHHGLTNAVLMPYVLMFNADAIGEKMGRLSHYLGLANGQSQSSRSAVVDVCDWIVGLRAEVGVPHTISSLGVDPKDFDLIAELAIRDPTAGTNPIPLTKQNMKALLADMYAGIIRK